MALLSNDAPHLLGESMEYDTHSVAKSRVVGPAKYHLLRMMDDADDIFYQYLNFM